MNTQQAIEIMQALNAVKEAFTSKAYLEQLEYVYTTNKRVSENNKAKQDLYNDILAGIEEVYENTGCEITLSINAIWYNDKRKEFSIDFEDDDSTYELFLNTNVFCDTKYEGKIEIRELEGGDVVVIIKR